MRTFNLHTHTYRCGHASGTDEEYVLAAIEAGFKTLGFSDHMPWEISRQFTTRMPMSLKDDYLKSVNQLKMKYQSQIKIYSGYEAEFFPKHLNELKQRRAEVDYMILGQHTAEIDGRDFDMFADDNDVKIYAQLIEQGCQSGLFSYVAHPDYFMVPRRVWNKTCIEAIERIIRAVKEADMAIEYNFRGTRFGLKNYGEHGMCYAYPFYPLWKIISDSQCKVVMGFDAHHPLTLKENFRYNEIDQILKGLPINWVDDVNQIIL